MNEKYDIFISYRRDGGESTAKMLHDKLESLGYHVFFDVESLRSGDFNTALYSVIESCRDFLLVLSPGAMDRCWDEGDWVRLEIEHALEQGLNIVPIMLRGFTFPQELPASINEVRYKNGIESSYQFFDAFIARLQKFLHTERPGTKWRFSKLMFAAVAVVCLGIGTALWLTGGNRTSGYPQTNREKNAVNEVIYYVESNLRQFEQVSEYMAQSYQACNEYIDNYDTASYSDILAQISRNKRELGMMDIDSSQMSADLWGELEDSAFEQSQAGLIHEYLRAFVKDSVDALGVMEALVDERAYVDLMTMKEIIENYQEILNEEQKCISYYTNMLFLAVDREDALEEFKHTFLPDLYYVNLSASKWNDDKKSLEGDLEKSRVAIEKARDRSITRAGDQNVEARMLIAETTQRLMSDGISLEIAELAVEDMIEEILLATDRIITKELRDELAEHAHKEAEKYLELSDDEVKKRYADYVPTTPTADINGNSRNLLWGKMVRFLDMGHYEEAISCMGAYYEEVSSGLPWAVTKYAKEYCASVVCFIQNIEKTGIDYGCMVLGYDPNDTKKNEQYKVGDVIIAVNGVPCHNVREYVRLQEEGQDATVMVLREDDKSQGELKQVELDISGDAPKVLILDMTKKYDK